MNIILYYIHCLVFKNLKISDIYMSSNAIENGSAGAPPGPPVFQRNDGIKPSRVAKVVSKFNSTTPEGKAQKTRRAELRKSQKQNTETKETTQ
jgi:hypothetical protein